MPRKKSESKPTTRRKVVAALDEAPSKPTTRRKKMVAVVESVPSVDAVIVAPRLSICDGKKKRFAEKQIKE